MHRNVTCTWSVIFSANNGPTALLYSKVLCGIYQMNSEFNNHTMRLDGFNTQSCFILSIGQLWGDGGLRDILIDAGVYASVTFDQMCLESNTHVPFVV